MKGYTQKHIRDEVLAEWTPIKLELESILGLENIFQKDRKKHLVEARFMFYTYCATRYEQYPKTALAWFGNQDHVTILHAIKTHYNWMTTERTYRERVNGIFETLDGIFKNNPKDTDREFLVRFIRNASPTMIDKIYRIIILEGPGFLDRTLDKNTFFQEPATKQEAENQEV